MSRGLALVAAAAVEAFRDQVAAVKDQPAWLTRAETSLERKLADLFRRVGREAVAATEAGRAPADVADLVGRVEDEYARLIEDATGDAARHARRRTTTEVEALPGYTAAAKAVDPEDVPIVGRRLRFTAATWARVRGDVQAVLDAAFREGLGIVEAAERLREVFEGLESWEAQRIARTEINGAAADASHAQLLELGVEFHEWVATLDGRVRDSHAETHGEVVRIGEPFSNGLLYPHEPGAPAEEVVNCRCRAAGVIPPEGSRPPRRSF